MRHRQALHLAVVLWPLRCFVLVGGLHTKHVRYLLPLVPFLALLAGDLCMWLIFLGFDHPAAMPDLALQVAEHQTPAGVRRAMVDSYGGDRATVGRAWEGGACTGGGSVSRGRGALED